MFWCVRVFFLVGSICFSMNDDFFFFLLFCSCCCCWLNEWVAEAVRECVYADWIYVRLICVVQINTQKCDLLPREELCVAFNMLVYIPNELAIIGSIKRAVIAISNLVQLLYLHLLGRSFHADVYLFWEFVRTVQLETDKLKQIINSKLWFSTEKNHLALTRSDSHGVLILGACVDVPHRFTFQRDSLIYKCIHVCVMCV